MNEKRNDRYTVQTNIAPSKEILGWDECVGNSQLSCFFKA
jgi:hypothetical protein